MVVFGLLLAQTQKYFFIFLAQAQKCLCHSEQMPNKKNDGTLPAPIHFNVNELLYSYNKCNENLHLLSISYPLKRGALFQGI